MLNNPALWERVDQDTYFKVFNIFAVMFVCAQFVALVDRYISPVIGCKRVNKKSWRFHTKYCYWFQKVESKVITKDCEQGKFVYFNPDEWVINVKNAITVVVMAKFCSNWGDAIAVCQISAKS
ncbi:uncharacterized protein LOC130824744 [Amaranthus tricolor]|uniref:uncharacterized protein LOC130824744 n=1 Tax=Amaranthus tricolor TaxID=29722 RepID=UPI0025857694|nr:uncharacterized protein LOC130824744 [Amaranthus tricolor]